MKKPVSEDCLPGRVTSAGVKSAEGSRQVASTEGSSSGSKSAGISPKQRNVLKGKTWDHLGRQGVVSWVCENTCTMQCTMPSEMRSISNDFLCIHTQMYPIIILIIIAKKDSPPPHDI